MSIPQWRGPDWVMAVAMCTLGIGAAACDRSPTETVGDAQPTDGVMADAKSTWSPWTMATIAPLPGDDVVELRDVNDAGLVVGSSGNLASNRALLGTTGGMIALGASGVRSAAAAVSNGATIRVAGTQSDASQVLHPVRWTVTLGATPSVTQQTLDDAGAAYGINDLGDIAGRSAAREAVIWPASGSRVVVSPPVGMGFTSAVAYDINNAGHVVGAFAAPDRRQAFLRLPSGALVMLSTSYAASEAKRVSELRQDGTVVVAGNGLSLSTSVSRAVRWTVDAGSGRISDVRIVGEASSASAISDAGDLGGTLDRRQGDRPVVWTDAATYELPVTKWQSAGNVVGISPNGRHAVGSLHGTMSNTSAIRWTRP